MAAVDESSALECVCDCHRYTEGEASGVEAVGRVKVRVSGGRVVARAEGSGCVLLDGPAGRLEVARVGPRSLAASDPSAEDSTAGALLLRCASGPARDLLHAAATATSAFDARVDRASSDVYFEQYGMIAQQQNMLQDWVRTSTYHAAVVENVADFAGKAVCDVGAGSGILSLFAARAGARAVYAVEASDVAPHAQALADANGLGAVVRVVRGRVEELTLPERVDVLISEPMGTALLNERMLESYIAARDRFLKPGGRMFPGLGRLHCAPFTDEVLHREVGEKAAFWRTEDFFGVDLRAVEPAATAANYAQVVVDAFDPRLLLSMPATHALDFHTATEESLHDVEVPLSFKVGAGPAVMHGVALWFDVLFEGSTTQRWLSTAPGLPTTHWFQQRLLLQSPFVVAPGQEVAGTLRLKAHRRQSYYVTLEVRNTATGQAAKGRWDLKDPYYRQLVHPQHQAVAAHGASQDQAHNYQQSLWYQQQQ